MRICLPYTLLGIIILMNACNPKGNPSKADAESVSEKVERLASQTFKEHSVFMNESESCFLVINRASYKPNESDRNLLFQLFSIKDESTILKDEISQGFVFWEDDRILLVRKYPGEIDDDQPNQFGYRFNVINKTRQAIK